MTVTNDATTAGRDDAPMSREWHYHPNLPIPVSPVFAWPPRRVEGVRWLASYWLAISAVVIELALAVFVWHALQPEPEQMKTLAFGWIAVIYLRNLVLMTLVAGGLHLYFYSFSRQGKKLKFDPRELARDNGKYTFRNQVHDNMFWTLASGVTVWTVYEVAYFWAAANGLVPLIGFADSIIWFVAWLIIIPIWSSLHFYWIHWVLHWPPLYRLAHSLHHRNVNIGPWTGISMHPVEHLLYYSSVLIHFVVPSHPIHMLFHLYLQSLNPPFSHCGFEGVAPGEKKLMEAGDFFHQLHHRYFECNYGTAEMPWDKWFGTFHDGTAHSLKDMRSRIAARHAANVGK